MRNWIVVTLLLIATYDLSIAQQCSIGLSSRDCMTCVSNLKTIMKVIPDTKIILDISELEDSSDIVEKFGLAPYAQNIEWHQLPAQSNGYPISWVTIEGKDGVIFKDTLKNLDLNDLIDAWEGRKHDSCKAKLPVVQKLSLSGKNVLLENLMYSRYYLYNIATDTFREIKFSRQLTDMMFDGLKWNESEKQFYRNLYERERSLRPKIAVASLNKDSVFFMGQILSLDEVVGQDSFYNKQFAIIRHVNDDPVILGLLNQKSLPKPYYYDETSLICWNGRFFIGVMMSSEDVEKTDAKDTLHKLAELTLGNGQFHFNQFLPLNIPSYLRNYKIGYNMSDLRSDQGLIGSSFSNTNYNLNNGEVVQIPLEERVLHSISEFMKDFSANFYIEDFIWEPSKSIYTVFFMQDKTYFIGTFKQGDSKFQTLKPFYARSEFLEKYYTAKLTNNGTSIIALTKPNRCLVLVDLNTLP